MKAEKSILPDISNHRYSVSIAQTDQEIEAALKLRYKVFYEELNREFQSANNIDQDEFDEHCHHLIVTEKETGNVVGTYRLQTYEQAVAGAGFYSETLFNMNEIPQDVLSKSFELGRACIEEEHRSGRVLFLLWKGFAGYLKAFDKRYLLGSLGIPAKSWEEGLWVYEQFRNNGDLNPDLRISAREPYQHGENDNKNTITTKYFEPPALLDNYLRIGCNIISKPAYHKDLKLFYVMIFLDINNLTPRTKRMFFD